jgi:uncharacterized protein YkwD
VTSSQTRRTSDTPRAAVASTVIAALITSLLALIAPAPAAAATGCSTGYPTEYASLTPTAYPGGTAWLSTLNKVRAEYNLAPVVEDPCLSAAAQVHAVYMAKTNAVGHPETDPRYATPAGARAGVNSVLTGGTDEGADATGSAAVRRLLAAPYHALAMLNPFITKVGFGQAQGAVSPSMAFAAVEVGSDNPAQISGRVARMPSAGSWPRVWPSNAGDLLASQTRFPGENPDPTRFCASAPSGYGHPVLVSFGVVGARGFDGLEDPVTGQTVNTLQFSSISGSLQDSSGSPIPVCVLAADRVQPTNTSTATFAPSRIGSTETGWLDNVGSVVVIPLQPLTAGQRYTGQVTGMTDQGKRTASIDFGVARSSSSVLVRTSGPVDAAAQVIDGSTVGVPAGSVVRFESSLTGQAPWTPVAGTAVVQADGSWSTTLTLPVGETTLRARYTGGNGSAAAVSDPVEIAVAVEPPSAPDDVAVAQVGSTSGLTVSWTPSPLGGAPEDYRVTVRRLGTSGGDPATVRTVTVPASATSTTVTGLTFGHDYDAVVVATNPGGDSDESFPAAPLFLAGPPAANGQVAATVAAYGTESKVTVTVPAAAGNGSMITEYRATFTYQRTVNGAVATGAISESLPQLASVPDTGGSFTFSAPGSEWVGSVSVTVYSLLGTATYPAKAVSFIPPSAITPTALTPPSTRTVRAGSTVCLPVSLRAHARDGFKDVTVYFTPSRTGVKARYATSTVNESGTVGLYSGCVSVLVRETGVWTFAYAGSRYDTATSRTSTVRAQTVISGMVTKAGSYKRGTVIRDGVVVSPGFSRTVTLQYRKYGTSSWKTYKTYRTSSKNAVTLTYKAFTGRYQWRVVVPDTKAGVKAVSGTRLVRGR